MAADPAGSFSRVFYAAAISLSVSYLNLLLLEERPLKTTLRQIEAASTVTVEILAQQESVPFTRERS